jgi:hypothetical protein
MVPYFLKMFRNIWLGILGCLVVNVSLAQDWEEKPNSITLFGGAEYGVNLSSLPASSVNFQDGFFHSAGFYYLHDFNAKWYLQPGVFYTQVLLSNSSRTLFSTTEKIHRLGLSLYAGYYVFKNKRVKLGVGGGAVFLYNLAGVQWNGELNEPSVTHLTYTEMNMAGAEVNAHVIFKYRLHQHWEFTASPFIQMNVVPVVKINRDYVLRTGVSLGVGYLF